MNSCAQACVCVFLCMCVSVCVHGGGVDGINHPCSFLVISTARLFTLITSFPKHTLTQKENFAGVDILCAGVQEQGMHTDTERISTYFGWISEACQSNSGEKSSLFSLTEQNSTFRSAVSWPLCSGFADLLSFMLWHALINVALQRVLALVMHVQHSSCTAGKGKRHKVKS